MIWKGHLGCGVERAGSEKRGCSHLSELKGLSPGTIGGHVCHT